MLREITVTHIEPKTSAKGTSYRVVTGGDGTKYNIWDAGVQVLEGKAYECEVIANTDPKFHDTIKHADISSNGHDAKALAAEMGSGAGLADIRIICLDKAINAILNGASVGETDPVEVARRFERYVTAG